MQKRMKQMTMALLVACGIWTMGVNTVHATETGNIIPGEENPEQYSYHIDTGTFDFTEQDSLGHPVYGNFQLYCIEPGVDLEFDYQITYDQAKALEGKKYSSSHGCASMPNNGDKTPIRFTPSGSYDLPPAAAYIVSHRPVGQKDLNKQRALYNLQTNGIDEGLMNGEAENAHWYGPSTYDQEAVWYADYDSRVRNKGLNPTDTTKIDDVYTKVNQETKEYTMGPFTMEYENGSYQDGMLNFSGVSEMTVNGYNQEKKLVKTGIKIEKIILENDFDSYDSAKEPDYFTPNDIKVDETEQVYPKPGQKFHIVFQDPNEGLDENSNEKVEYVTIQVKFQYMLAYGKYTELLGTKYEVKYEHEHQSHTDYCGARTCYGHPCYSCQTTCYLETYHNQNFAAADAIRVLYEQEFELGKDYPAQLDITMNLGGNVWEDGVGGDKENSIDGRNDKGSSNQNLKNIKVTLYTQDGKIATLLNDKNEGNIMHRINPTLTDEDGNYLFIGLDAMQKYYVVFEYNGQIYMPTIYGANWEGSLSDWKATSKGTEKNSERDSYDKRFASIGSYPENYQRPKGGYNASYSNRELMGYTLGPNGKYSQTQKQLIDGYLYDSKGVQLNTYSAEGELGKQIRNYIEANKTFPTDMEAIYSQIAGGSEELLSKLHFIEDTLMKSYTKPQNGNNDLYPKPSQFIINHTANNEEKSFTTVKQFQNANYPYQEGKTLDGIHYEPIYPKMYFINQGLWVRQKADMALRKDVYNAALQINGKTEVYEYNKRKDGEGLWEIAARVSDANYYDSKTSPAYSREIYPADYHFNGFNGKKVEDKDKLNVYVTYQIQVRNQSQSILTQIDEIVDYYDATYTFMPNMSWVMYGTKKDLQFTDKEYRDIIINKAIKDTGKMKAITASENSKYGENTKTNLSDYKNVYIQGLQSNKMAIGETAYVYLTFKVNGSGSNLSLGIKHNIAEINGYTTYYKDGTSLPNYGTKGASNYAGLIDVDSNPGNITQKNFDKEYLWEDDTDRAQGLKIYLDNSLIRKINGTTWEDKRNTQVSGTDSVIGNGIYENGETLIPGIGVELYEVIDGKTSNTIAYVWNGNAWVQAKTTTNNSGKYEFSGYIPGDYVVRFTYGGNYNATYNGQDFKSTTYQAGITQSGQSNSDTLAERKYDEYTNVNSQNESAKYGYNIQKADSLDKKVSDAKDIWSRRQLVNYNSSGSISYAKAEILSKNKVANQNTQMTAETGVIAVELEYNRTNSNGDNKQSNGSDKYKNGNDTNKKYVIQDVDFGLIERPKAGLELTKKVNNVKIMLSNGNILFDAKASQNNLLWNASKEYNTNSLKSTIRSVEGLNKNIHNEYTQAEIASYRTQVNSLVLNNQPGLIQATMDEEIMHGATIQITYDFKVSNIGEVDYNETSFYYTGKVANSSSIVKTSADTVVDYVENNLQFRTDSNRTENGWSTISKETLKTLVSDEVAAELPKYNSVLKTNALNKKLIPLTETTKQGTSGYEQTYDTAQLVLTQLITPENTSDDMNYQNTAEIVQITNDVGRRMAFSIQGNQNPSKTISEIDSSRAEKVVILPPFGETKLPQNLYLWLGLAATAAALIGASVIIIKKKVLR